jgi:hypothetical protein
MRSSAALGRGLCVSPGNAAAVSTACAYESCGLFCTSKVLNRLVESNLVKFAPRHAIWTAWRAHHAWRQLHRRGKQVHWHSCRGHCGPVTTCLCSQTLIKRMVKDARQPVFSHEWECLTTMCHMFVRCMLKPGNLGSVMCLEAIHVVMRGDAGAMLSKFSIEHAALHHVADKACRLSRRICSTAVDRHVVLAM